MQVSTNLCQKIILPSGINTVSDIAYLTRTAIDATSGKKSKEKQEEKKGAKSARSGSKDKELAALRKELLEIRHQL